MVRWLKRKTRSQADLRATRTVLIASAIFWLGWTALHTSESPDLGMRMGDWPAASWSAACAVGAAYY